MPPGYHTSYTVRVPAGVSGCGVPLQKAFKPILPCTLLTAEVVHYTVFHNTYKQAFECLLLLARTVASPSNSELLASRLHPQQRHA